MAAAGVGAGDAACSTGGGASFGTPERRTACAAMTPRKRPAERGGGSPLEALVRRGPAAPGMVAAAQAPPESGRMEALPVGWLSAGQESHAAAAQAPLPPSLMQALPESCLLAAREAGAGLVPTSEAQEVLSNTQATSRQVVRAHGTITVQRVGHPEAAPPTYEEWRGCVAIRDLYWLCPRCRVTNNGDACRRCYDSKEALLQLSSTEATDALLRNTQHIAYGRNLVCGLSSRERSL